MFSALRPQLGVFIFGCHAAADMPLLFIFIQNFLYLGLQIRIDLQQAKANVFMNCTFAEVEHLGRLTNGCLVIHNVIPQHHCSLFGDAFQILSLPLSLATGTLGTYI